MGYFILNPSKSEDLTVRVDKIFEDDDSVDDFADKTKRLVYIIFILVVVLLAIFIMAIVIRICLTKRNP
jgi:lipopolysaccharide/colanic/teichoic acid biosynthesis glycosyltransferase